MKKKKISVVIPCYNVEQYINRCLDSIIGQTYGAENLEIILVDDASSDATPELLRSFEERYSEQTLLVDCDGRKLGVSEARNVGMQHASGEYIAFVDADDVALPNMLEALYEAAEKYDCDYTECGYQDFYKPEELTKPAEITEDFFDLSDSIARRQLILDSLKTAVWGRLYKTSFLREKEIFFPTGINYAEDVLFTALCFFEAGKYCRIKEPLYGYFQNEQGLMNGSYSFEKMKTEIQILELMTWELQRRGLYDSTQKEYRPEFEFYCVWKCYCDPVSTILSRQPDPETRAREILYFRDYVRTRFPQAAQNEYFDECSAGARAIIAML